MAAPNLSTDDMLARTARFAQLKPSKQAFVDSRLPEHRRDIFNVIGRGVTEDTSLAPAIAQAQDFNLTYVGAEPGKGAALHAHPSVEVFVAMSGRWAVYWGEDGGNEIELDPWDVVSVPPGVMRGFRNVGEAPAHLMAILGGTDAGKVDWATSVTERAAATGLVRDRDGNLIDTSI